jgi:hypothetical protein
MAVVTKVEITPFMIHDDQVEFPPVRIATARVLESWKGPQVREVYFWASPMEMCDIAHAEKGEEVILFLERSTFGPIMRIGHVGRGRMVLQGAKKEERFAEVEQAIKLPSIDGVSKVLKKEPYFGTQILVDRITLNTLRNVVQKYVAEQNATKALAAVHR